MLEKKGFFEERDYYYYYYCNYTKLTDLSGYYKDINGNEIYGRFNSANITLENYNTHMYIGKNVQLSGVNIQIGNGSKLIIEDNVYIEPGSAIRIRDNSTLYIGNKSFGKISISVLNDSVLYVGNGTSFVNASFKVESNSFCYIGNDCMVSYEVTFQSSDSHNIFDLEKKENITAKKKREIIIGDHVWLGRRSILLYGTQIGDGSIVGTNTFVNKKFGNNVVIAGNPARVVRENAAWDRQLYPFIEDERVFEKFDFRNKRE